MTFENTYLMMLYFKNKKKIISKNSFSRKVSFNKDADKIIFDLENDIANYCLMNNISDETMDNRCYPSIKKI
jgi:hypothetical protein